jgi:hypothetical protein
MNNVQVLSEINLAGFNNFLLHTRIHACVLLDTYMEISIHTIRLSCLFIYHLC